VAANPELVSFVRLTDVHQGQHHKDKGLQHNDQNMKYGPA
jgi:hypothetical protein